MIDLIKSLLILIAELTVIIGVGMTLLLLLEEKEG